jgi:ketosteroid isomerase-like protein
MYKATVRALVRRGLDRINEGDAGFLLRMASPEAEIVFPGDNSWAAMYRPVRRGRHPHPTHRGIEECRGFADRFVQEGIRFEVEDILVNGPPWNTRVAVRANNRQTGPDGTDRYNNRLVAFLELRWGRLVRWEDYEDTQRVADWDLARSR